MTAASRPIRLQDGRVYRDRRSRSLELREPLERAVRKALINGTPAERVGRRAFKLGWVPSCENPIPWIAYGVRSEYLRGHRDPISIFGQGRCRKCEPCKKARSQMWTIRAMAEYQRWPITIFGTVTMSPEEHYRHDAIIVQGTRGDDGQWRRHPANIHEMSATELFAARVGVFGDELQKFLKRVRTGRKIKPGQLRYLLVAEAHDGPQTSEAMRGRPHFHVMLHECQPGILVDGNPRTAFVEGQSGEYIRVRYKSGPDYREGVFVRDDAFLRTQWTLGFTKFQFAESARAAGYLCKYLNKCSDSRVRASQNYGLEETNKETGVAYTARNDSGRENGPTKD